MSRNPRRGFSLIELMIAIVMLAIVVLGLSMSTSLFSRAIVGSSGRTRAQALADIQINRAAMWPEYGALSALAGTRTVDPFTIATTVAVDSSSRRNRTLVSVTVTSSNASVLLVPIRRRITVSAP
ncbi:prepilin-type N-terminal cleavage/methylation domain-containing protein [Gemmatimonas sp.]|uniref:type IV pilus modification PilV family protein n=1 Tax=Gemmatimonas sp. TaxID=1962908 RepID=UPI0033413696